MFDRISAALEALAILHYKDVFVENALDDALVEECVSDDTIGAHLEKIIPVLGHRLKFIKKFKEVRSADTVLTKTPKTAYVAAVEGNGGPFQEEITQGTSSEPTEDIVSMDIDEDFVHPILPQPVQVMNFKQTRNAGEPDRVWCNEKALESILQKTGNRRVAILAIAGPTRKGKSVFMNFVLRRLNGLVNDEIDWMGWATGTEPLTGFSWEASDERVTTGIWIWSEPFTLKSKKDGSEFDVLLMDTQGVFDERSGPREWSILMGLSLLTSSCLLFNIVNNVEEKDLQLLDEFLSFGLMVLEDKKEVSAGSQKAFQKLVFLIRDWNNPGQFPYGSIGGKAFIEKKLEVKDFHQACHKAVRDKLKKCCEEVSCVLLPHPGLDAIQLNFNGSIASCITFAHEVEKSILELVDENDLPAKSINGNYLSGQDYLELFRLYVALFNANHMNSEAIYAVTSQGCNYSVVNKCVSSCMREIENRLRVVPFLPSDTLNSYCQAAVVNAFTLFENSRKMGGREIINQAKENLSEQLQNLSTGIKLQNSEMRSKALSRARTEALLRYATLMEDAIAAAKEFLEDIELRQVSEAAEIRTLQLFQSLLQLASPDDLVDEKEEFRKSVRDKLVHYKNRNKEKRNEAEKLLEDAILVIVEQYILDMDSKINGEILSDEELQRFHSAIVKKCLDYFDRNHSTSLLHEQGQKSLVNKIFNEYDNLQKFMSISYENINCEGEARISEALAYYRQEMMYVMGIDEEAFNNSHQLVRASSMEILGKSETISSRRFMDKFSNELESKIHGVHMVLLLLLQQNKAKVEDDIRRAKEGAKAHYEEFMQGIFDEQENPIPDLQLEYWHNIVKSEANNLLVEFYESMKTTLNDWKEQEVASLTEIAEVINNMFSKFREANTLRWSAYEAKAYNYLFDAKTEYAKRLKKLMDDTYDLEELKRNDVSVRTESRNYLLAKLDPTVAKPELIKNLDEELLLHMEDHFEKSLEVFELRLEEDAIVVKAALFEAKKYYNEEMDKRFNVKDWLPDEELLEISEELTAMAIDKCKESVFLTKIQEKQLVEAMHTVYLKYSEENTRRYPAKNIAIGIDLGTTYSCVGVYMNGSVTIIPNEGSTTTPSFVAFNDDRTIDVGEVAKAQAFRNSQNTIFDAKRLIGRAFSDPLVQQDINLWPFDVISDDDKPQIRVRDKNYRPEEISAKVLVKMKRVAEKYLNKSVKLAVVTVPAYFNDGQRQATRDAAEIAGLKIKILNEPTAAAITFKLHRPDELKRNVLIFDLGGGTFDVAVLEMKGGKITVKATAGNTHLGGEDFDNAMVNAIIDRVKVKHGIDLSLGKHSSDPIQKSKASERIRRIRDHCEAAKRMLSSETNTVIDMVDDEFHLNEIFTREEFERLNMAHFELCIDIVRSSLEDAKLDKADVDDIVLVGGSTRIPKVQELLKAFFDWKKELNSTVNPDEAVVYGASIQAALLNGEQAKILGHGIELSDVAPLSLGIEIVTGEMSKIICKNSPVPCTHTQVFKTVVNNQTTVNFKVFEGEKSNAVENNFLGKFLLTGIPSAPAGREPIDCTMTIDSEGILHVKAVSRNNGNSSDIIIQTYNGRMTQVEIDTAQMAEHFRW